MVGEHDKIDPVGAAKEIIEQLSEIKFDGKMSS
jgi:hypothetical protein